MLLTSGETDAADGYLDIYISLRKRTHDDINVMRMLGGIYSDGGALNRAEEYFRKALSLADSLEKPSMMNSLAWFLINNERNNDEGMRIIERALELQPDNYNFLDTKGWGLYKQEKYRQALALIERSWELKPIYSHTIYLHLEAVKEAIDNQ